jgi:hypothetical protein
MDDQGRDIVGGFVARCINVASLSYLLKSLESLGFTLYSVDGSTITTKRALFDGLSSTLSLWDDSSERVDGWDAFSDLMWQRLVELDLDKVALVCKSADTIASANLQLLIEWIEICILLQGVITQHRLDHQQAPLLIRLYLIGENLKLFPPL